MIKKRLSSSMVEDITNRDALTLFESWGEKMNLIKDAELRGLTKVYASIIVLDYFSRRPALFKFLHDKKTRFDLKFTLEACTDQNGLVIYHNLPKSNLIASFQRHF